MQASSLRSALVLPSTPFSTTSAQCKPEAEASCGPFKLVEWVKGNRLVMDRFDKYFVPAGPYLDRVIIRTIKDPVTQMAAFKAAKWTSSSTFPPTTSGRV